MNCESKKYRRIVIKIGSNVLTREDGRPDTTRISALVDQIAGLYRAGTEVVVGDRTIDVHIRKLRQKIGDERIVTIKGVGYKFEP